MAWYLILFMLPLYSLQGCCCSSIRVEDNGYKGLLVALPRFLEKEERAWLVLNVEAMIRSSSVILQQSSKGRAYLAEVSFLVPDSWEIPTDDASWESTAFNSSTFHEATTTQSAEEADIIVTEGGQHPYVLHQSGCGQRAMRIILPKSFLLSAKSKGLEFTRLWSEYRYGVFPEGGFINDEKYPLTYSIPGENGKVVTGCSDLRFWISNSCDVYNKECKGNLTSSLMDHHSSSFGKLFCEGYVGLGPRHNPRAPSKQNLVCKEECTWFTVMRSPDFTRGRNAAPRHLQDASDVSFHFIRERTIPKVILALETSSKMYREDRISLVKSPLYRFLYSVVPDGSEVTLIFFGGDEGVKIEKRAVVLENMRAVEHFIESLAFPENVSEAGSVALEELFDVVLETIINQSQSMTSSADIIIITTRPHVSASAYPDIRQGITESGSRLHVMLFDDVQSEDSYGALLYDLCLETGGHLTSLHVDIVGDMHKGFQNVFKRSHQESLIMQDYLKTDDEKELVVSFNLDESLAKNLKVYLSYPIADTGCLEYKKTTLQKPSGGYLNFLKMNVLDAWVLYLDKPEAGEYILRTRRKKEKLSSVLITVTATPSVKEDPITVRVWAETVLRSGVVPAPVKILSEIRNGWKPVTGAQVTATISNPDGEISTKTLLDDGLGDVDITKDDGIYGSYYARLTSSGYYNVYVKVAGRANGTEVLTGPGDFCCGSFFPAAAAHPVRHFQREAGPFTFYVPTVQEPAHADKYPPSRVTDLRVSDQMDSIFILQWTAVGDDYDSGFAAEYELKVFRDAAIIYNRFADSGQEIYSETINATAEAVHGTPLNHAFQLPSNVRGGLHYVAIRAVDDLGNAGEPSNAVPLWIEDSFPKTIDCESQEKDCENGECEVLPKPEQWRGNSAPSFISSALVFGFVPLNAIVPIMSLKLCLIFFGVM